MSKWIKTTSATVAPASRNFQQVAATARAVNAEPYVRWAEATEWRGYRREQQGVRVATPKRVRILARAHSAAHLKAVFAHSPSLFEIAAMYDQVGRVPGGDGKPALHFTATVGADQLHRLDEPQFGLRWELAVPLREAQTQIQADRLGYFGGAERDAEKMLSKQVLGVGKFKPKPVGHNAPIGDAIAVIDYGAPFLNQRFTYANGSTRVKALWDQDKRFMRDWWCEPERTGYGRELGADAINAMLKQLHNGSGQALLDEGVVYRSLDYLIAYADPRRRAFVATHGAHVLDMAGGADDPLQSLRTQPQALKKGQRDAAGDASLVFVQLPALTAADSSGGSLGAQLLDAVRYVLGVCGAAARVVVNISYGSTAGSHDGTSLTESALDELLLRREKNFAIVLAAGNSRRAGCHARRVVSKEKTALLRFVLVPGDTTDTFVELWFERTAPYAPGLVARVRTPGRDWSNWIAANEEVMLTEETSRRTVALMQNLPHAAGSENQAMILLATAPTAAAVDDDGPLAESGVWELEVRLHPAHNGRNITPGESLAFDAWIERDDPGDTGMGPQPHFIGLDHDDERNTLSSLATGKHTVIVGGYQVENEAPASYSSLPARLWPPSEPRKLPMVLAACEESVAQASIRAAAVRSLESHRMNGTSVAAPVLARRLFNVMKDRDVTRSQWPDVLEDLSNQADSFVRMPMY